MALRSPSEKGDRPRLLFVALPPTWEMNPPLKLVVCRQSHDHCSCYSTVQINSRHCSQRYLKSLKTGENWAECQGHEYQAQACCKTYGDLRETVGIAFTGVRAGGASRVTRSAALLAQSLEHIIPFLWRWVFFSCAVVIVRLFQNLTALSYNFHPKCSHTWFIAIYFHL